MRQDELMHYGVLGMKWGIRRARKNGGTYAYQSHGTKKYARKAAKYESKGNTEKANKYKRYHKRSVELDSRMQKSAARQSLPKVAAKMALVTGTGGSRTYEVTRAATIGMNKNVSRGLAALNSYFTGIIGATPVRAAYVRYGDNGKDICEKILKKK